MKKFKGKIHFSTILVLDIEAENAENANNFIKGHVNLIASRNYEASNANEHIKAIHEYSYADSIGLMEVVDQGVVLG